VSRKAGVTERQLLDLATFEQSAAFSNSEKLALRLAVALTRTPLMYQTYQTNSSRGCGASPEAQLVEMAAAITWENNRADFPTDLFVCCRSEVSGLPKSG
jgi:alkylhydroperoxidase family enzyme